MSRILAGGALALGLAAGCAHAPVAKPPQAPAAALPAPTTPPDVAAAPDGSLFVTDDGSRSIWHVIYTGK